MIAMRQSRKTQNRRGPRRPCEKSFYGRLTLAENNASLGEVVWREFDLHFVARDDTNKIPSHLARYVGNHFVATLERHTKPRVRQGLGHGTFNFKCLFLFGHKQIDLRNFAPWEDRKSRQFY